MNKKGDEGLETHMAKKSDGKKLVNRLSQATDDFFALRFFCHSSSSILKIFAGRAGSNGW